MDTWTPLDPPLVYGSLTLSILTITQRHGGDGWLVVSAVWVMVGLGMKGGVIGGVWEVWGGLCGGGVCTVHRLDEIKRRVVPALP